MNLKKIDVYYIITLLFLLLSANANILSASDIIWFVVMIFMVIVAASKKQITVKDLRHIGIFSICYLFFMLVRDLFINSLDSEYLLSEVVFLVKYIYISFLFCILLRERAMAYIVKVTVHLTIISFIFYFFQLLVPDLMYKLFTALNVPTGNNLPGYTNFVLFTFTKNFHDYTNSGFVWEPGSFGCFLVIALLMHFFINKFRFDRNANILIIGILSTVSTTDYLALLVLLFLAYRYRVPKINLWVVILVPLFLVIIWFVPFLGDKIKTTFYEDMDDLHRMKVLEKFYHHSNMQIPLNRFSSMNYIFNTFGNQLILGVSNKYNAILNRSFNVNISNGVFDLLAKFGLVGFLYLFFYYGKVCLEYVVRAEYVIYCILILAISAFGEPILFLPLVLIFMFLSPGQELLKKKKARGRKAAEEIL